MTTAQAVAVTLWIAHTHAFAASRRTPYLIVTSPREECGKSLLVVEVLPVLVARAWTLEGPPSEAVLFRKIDRDEPSMMVDESESMFGSRSDRYEGMRSIILGGNRRGATTPRCLNRGEDLKDYKTYSPKAFAAIKADAWPRTLLSRSIVIHMQRVRADEPIEDFYSDVEDEDGSKGAQLHQDLKEWVNDELTEALRRARPERLPELGRRAWEGWVPLINIADMAGPVWAKRARDAAIALSSQEASSDTDTDIELALLAAIRDVFAAEDTDRLWTKPLLEKLNGREEAPWAGWNDGVGIKPHELAKKLRPYGIHSKKLRLDGEKNPRHGYERSAFGDIFDRYLSDDSDEDDSDDSVSNDSVDGTDGTSALPSQKPGVTKTEQTPDVPSTEGAENPHSNAVVPSVPANGAGESRNGSYATVPAQETIYDLTREDAPKVSDAYLLADFPGAQIVGGELVLPDTDGEDGQ